MPKISNDDRKILDREVGNVHRTSFSCNSKAWATSSQNYSNMTLNKLAICANDIFLSIALQQPNSQISGVAHLGGAVVAALFWARIKKGWF